MIEMIKLFTKYFSVGILNTLIHWSFWTTDSISFNPQAIANLIGFIAAVSFSFLLMQNSLLKPKLQQHGTYHLPYLWGF